MKLGKVTFVARQKRITVDATDYYLDLLFFHRELRRLVAIDLKLGKFKPEHEGQMLLYLRYLNQNERKAWEESPIGRTWYFFINWWMREYFSKLAMSSTWLVFRK